MLLENKEEETTQAIIASIADGPVSSTCINIKTTAENVSSNYDLDHDASNNHNTNKLEHTQQGSNGINSSNNDNIYANLMQFLEESSTIALSNKNNKTIDRDEETSSNAANLLKLHPKNNNKKPTPQDEKVDPVHHLTSTSITDNDSSIRPYKTVGTKTTKNENKNWIWDEFDNSASSQHLHPCHLLSSVVTSRSTTSVEEKEHIFQSLVAKIKILHETLAEKNREVIALDLSLNESKASHAARIFNQQTNWKDAFNKQDLEHTNRTKRQRELIEQVNKDCTVTLRTKIDSLKLRHKTISSPLSSQEHLNQLKTKLEREKQELRKIEKLRLAKFVDAKIEHIKSKVAKSMEPEWTHLLNQNKKELQQLGKKFQHEIELLKRNLETDYEARFINGNKILFDEVDVEINKIECYQQKYVMDLTLQHDAKLQMERNNLRQEFEQDRALFEEQCKALRYGNTEIENNSDDEEKKILQRVLDAHQDDMERYSRYQTDITQSKRDELFSQSADFQEMREHDLRQQYSKKRDAATEALQSKSLKDIVLIESMLESERMEQKITTKKQLEEEINRLVCSHQDQLSKVTNETREVLETLMVTSNLANETKSQVSNLDNQIADGNLTHQELIGNAYTLKELIGCALHDVSFVDRLRSELALREESVKMELQTLTVTVEQARHELNITNDAQVEELEQLKCTQRKEMTIIRKKVQALLDIKNGELEAKRESLFALREEYVLKSHELDTLRQDATTSHS